MSKGSATGGVPVVSGLQAVASPDFVEYQERLGTYRIQKLDELKEKQQAKEQEDLEKAEQLDLGKIQDLTKDIVPGFQNQVDKESNAAYARINEIVNTPGRTNTEKYIDFDRAIQDFSNKLKPMISTSNALRHASILPEDKLTPESQQFITNGSVDGMIDGSIDWNKFQTINANANNSLHSWTLDSNSYGFAIRPVDIANPEDLTNPKGKNTIVPFLTQQAVWTDAKTADGRSTGYQIGRLDPDKIAAYADQIMNSNPAWAPGGSIQNGFIKAGYGSPDPSGNGMMYTIPGYDASGNPTGLVTKPTDQIHSEVRNQLIEIMKNWDGQRLTPPYSTTAMNDKKELANINANAKASSQSYSEAPILNAYVSDITKKQDEANKQLSESKKERNSDINQIVYKNDKQYADDTKKINEEYDKKDDSLKEEYDKYTNQINLVNTKNAYLNSKGITDQKTLKELHQQIGNPEQSLDDFKAIVDKSVGGKETEKPDKNKWDKYQVQ